MIKREITVINKLGLHARAAAKLVAAASHHSSTVHVYKEGRQADAKSIMAVMMLAASKGSNLVFEIDGKDEEIAWDAISTLINNRFDEEE